MSTRYWDRVARSWDEHIMCSLHEDVSGNIESMLRSVASRHRRILDFGCGVGGYLHFLSENFDEVSAADTSRGCVERARHLAGRLPNVTVCPVSELRRSKPSGSFDAVLMANVLLSPDPTERRRILREAIGLLGSTGELVLVVPSIESVQLAEAVRRRFLPRRRSAYSMAKGDSRLEPGTVEIHGQPTKHHSAEELAFELAQEGLAVAQISRAQYSWASEGFDQLDGVVSERPWDWLVRAARPATGRALEGAATRRQRSAH